MKAGNNSVIIKGNKYGIIVVLSPEVPFEELKRLVEEKFKESSKFFENAKMALSFEGRKLTNEEQKEILDIINENTDMHIVCVIENDPETEEIFHKTLDQKLLELSNNTGQFYKGILRSGAYLEFETSVVIIGDVNHGARVVSKGNIIVLGSLKGNAFAGACGNKNSFVVALDMRPMQIRIADTIARSPDKPVKEESNEAKIAFLEDGNIYIEPLNKSVLSDISL
jgi:septum site-determining protein MinC